MEVFRQSFVGSIGADQSVVLPVKWQQQFKFAGGLLRYFRECLLPKYWP